MIGVGKSRDRAAMFSTIPGSIVISGFADAKVMNTNDQRLALPLIQIAKAAYGLIMPRSFIRGRSSDGGSYGSFSSVVKTDAKGNLVGLWVPPDMPQPEGAVSDKWKNRPGKFKVYRSSAHYQGLMGNRSKRFVTSGQSARSYVIKPMGPTRVRLLPQGRRGRGRPSNLKVMGYAARNAGKSPIRPTRAEVAELGKLAQTLLTPQLIESAYWSALSVSARKKIAQRQRGLQRLIDRELKARAQMKQTGGK